MKSSAATSSTKLYPIQVAARRSGVNVELLRAWERRYAVVEPARHAGGRRLYDDADVARLSLLRRAVEGGLRIKDAAARSDDELEAFLASASQPSTAAGVRHAGDDAAAFLDECCTAVREQDHASLERSIDRARVALPVPELLDGVIGPLAAWIGEAWSDGQLRIYQEHRATVLLREVLASLARTTRPGIATFVSTTLSGEVHELGAMLAAAGGAAAGWRAEYVGADLPAAEIAAAANRLGARAVSLSVVLRDGEGRLEDELRLLRRLVGPEIALFVGGRAADRLDAVLREIDARRMTTVSQLVKALGALPL